jgi:hypothetical protein
MSPDAPQRTPRDVAGPVLAVALSLFLAGVVALTLLAPEPTMRPTSVSAEQPGAGGAVCAVGTTGPQTETTFVVTAVSDVDVDATAARINLLVLDEVPQRIAVDSLAAGEMVLVRPELDTTGWIWTGWADRAAVTWREWSSVGGPGLPRGRSAAPCVPTSASSAVVPGLRTDGGNEAYVTLANPFTVDATFALTFLTPVGDAEPIALRNVSVSPGERVVIRVNDHLPREADVAAIVTIGAGRLAVEGHQLALAGIGQVDGLSFVQASTVASTSWTIPWLVQDESRSTWLSVVNLEPRSVSLDVVVHTASGPVLPEGFEVITVPPFSLLRVPATDLAPRSDEPFGVTLTSETTGVHVAAGLQVIADSVEATGIATYLGSPAGDARWIVAGAASPDRSTVLHVVNLGEQSADATITLRVQSAEDVTISRRPLPTLTVPSGAVARITLPLPEDGIWSVEVSGPPHLVVSRTSTGLSLLEPVVTPAVPSSTWRRPVEPLAGRALRGWARALGTDADLRPLQPSFGVLPPSTPTDGG